MHSLVQHFWKKCIKGNVPPPTTFHHSTTDSSILSIVSSIVSSTWLHMSCTQLYTISAITTPKLKSLLPDYDISKTKIENLLTWKCCNYSIVSDSLISKDFPLTIVWCILHNQVQNDWWKNKYGQKVRLSGNPWFQNTHKLFMHTSHILCFYPSTLTYIASHTQTHSRDLLL